MLAPYRGPHLENSFVGIAGPTKGGQQFGNLLWSSSFHRDVNGRVAKVHAVIGAVVGSLDYVGAVLRQNSSQAVQRARIIRQVDAEADQAAILHQAAFHDSREQADVNIPAADQNRNFLSAQ